MFKFLFPPIVENLYTAAEPQRVFDACANMNFSTLSGQYEKEIIQREEPMVLRFTPKGEFGMAYNSFAPRIEIRISAEEERTKIQVKMELMRFVRIFIIVWLTAAFLFFLPMLASVIKGGQLDMPLFIPLIMMVFGYSLAHFGLRFSAKDKLREIKKKIEQL